MSHDLASELAAAAARRDVTTFRAVLLDARRRTPRPRSSSWSRIRASWSSTSSASSSSSSSGAASPRERALRRPAARRGRARAGRLRAGCVRHVGLLSVEPPARARPARAAAPRAAPGPQPLRDHRRRSRSGWSGCASPSPGCRSGARWCRRWRTRASAASCGWPTSTCSTSRTSTGSSGGVADVGVSKVVLAAREVAELDPVHPRRRRSRAGSRRRPSREFVDGADVVVDECDGLEIKVRLREHARAARPARGDGDEPSRDARRRALRPRAAPAAVPRAARRRHLGRARRPDDQAEGPVRDPHPRPGEPHASARRRRWSRSRRRSRRGRSSRRTSRSAARWSPTPSGGSRSASFTASGRFYADLDELTADGRQAPLAPAPAAEPAPAPPAPPGCRRGAGAPSPADELRFIVACASSAPSGGNMQPWRFEARADVIRAWVDPTRSSLLDFRDRAALLALGAALEAAKIGARALGFEPVARPVAADGPVWELALERWTARARRGRRSKRPVAALLQPAHRRVAADPGCRARATRRVAARRWTRASSPATRSRSSAPRSARSTACASSRRGCGDDLIGELRFTPEEAHAVARRHRRRLARARRRRPRGDGRPAHRRRHGRSSPSSTAAGACATPPATRSRRRRRASCCAPRRVDRAALRRRRPRAHAAVARGHAPRARRSIRGARRSCSSACSRTPTRWRDGSATR